MKETSKQTYHSNKTIPGIGYKLFKAYVRFLFSGMYNHRNYVIDRTNLPAEGPLMIVSNHQNSLNDALALLMAVGERGKRKVRAITRADAFKPVIGKIFRWVGLMPAYRMQYDGAETLDNNSFSFTEAADELLHDGTVIIYPEAGHQVIRWLGDFTYGYLKILFDAAKQSGFQKEIYLLPSCNHYEDFVALQTDVMIRFGQPIALSPFYELYQTKPRTAQRQVNALVREQISEMMLNITDLENYEAIDFIRETYGRRYAKRKGLDPDHLPEKLEADKELFRQLDKCKKEGIREMEDIYQDAAFLSKSIRESDITDEGFDNTPSLFQLMGKALLLTLLFPLYLMSLVPNLFIILAPRPINKRIDDFMFHGTIRIILAVLITVPVTCIVLFILAWILGGSAWAGVGILLCLPLLFLFVVRYNKMWIRFRRQAKFYHLDRKGKLDTLRNIRERMYERIEKVRS